MAWAEDIIEARTRFGFRVRRLRKGQQLTQEQLGEMAGVGRTSISRLESGCGSASFETIMRLANSFGLSPSELLAGIAEPRREPGSELPVRLGLAEIRSVRYEVVEL